MLGPTSDRLLVAEPEVERWSGWPTIACKSDRDQPNLTAILAGKL